MSHRGHQVRQRRIHMFNYPHSFAPSGSTGCVTQETRLTSPCRIGLALGGGFARGIAHAGVLKVLEERKIPIHCVAGGSAGSIAAAAFSSGATSREIAETGSAMRFRDVAKLSINRMGLVGTERMVLFLRK